MPYMNHPVMPALLLQYLGITNENLHYQESPETLVQQTLNRQEGRLSGSGALVIQTGKFTGRSPQDKFIVKDAITATTVDWNNFNIPISEKYFLQLRKKMVSYLNKLPELWVRDAQVCSHPEYRLSLRIVNEDPASNLFAYNMFLRQPENLLEDNNLEWTILHAPHFTADPAEDGTRQSNFAIISFTHQTILIGGTGYTGEIKKGVFTILNYLLPQEKEVLSMHCSANVDSIKDTAVFFGLSGTGKTTLSADPKRRLIGDDEHGWDSNSIFNFEGGCYAKVIDLSPENEPAIYHAIRPGALVENTRFLPGSNMIDFADRSITENTRVSYPLHYIPKVQEPAIGSVPQNIFFLSADAYGILPPISRLSTAQAMYYFISGYTARVAGTEAGVLEPKATFSACFGAPFLPLHPGKYAALLGQKLQESGAYVWLINTGWIGGAYGVGKRISLAHTRSLINAALEGTLDDVEYKTHPIFHLQMPATCPGVPDEVLNPYRLWENAAAYETAAKELATAFSDNFKKYEAGVSDEIKKAGPIV